MKTDIVRTSHSEVEPRVLLVDDDPNIRWLLREGFEEAGFSVREADGGLQALEQLEHWWPDVILLDVIMTEMDGFDTCCRIRQSPGGNSLPVLMMTGLNDEETFRRAFEVGATDVLGKPPNWHTLLHRVRWCVDYSRALQRLAEAEEAQRKDAEGKKEFLFRTVVEELPYPLMVLRPDGSVRYENPLVSRWFGKTAGLSESGNFLQRVPPDARRTLSDELSAVIENPREVRACEFRIGRSDGSGLVFEATMQNLLHDKRVEGILVLCHDITEEKELEDGLTRAQETSASADQAKSEYLAIISHELRSPLNMILGHTDLMLDDLLSNLSGKQMESLLQIRKSARGLLELIFSLLDITRLDGGVLPVEIEEVSVTDLLRQMEPEFDFLQDGSDVDFIWKIDVGLWSVSTDRSKLMVVIRNLIHNAFKYTKRGKITVSAHNKRDHVEISVADTGVGIPPHLKGTIFEPFRRLDAEQTDRQGTGLGLYVVRRFSELIGARIEVESVVGHGSCFRLSVPAVEDGSTRSRAAAQLRPLPATKN